MDWLNYHHLLYFWTVVQEGSVSAAAERLGLAQPTVSAQIRKLEEAMARKLLEKSGRRVVLTDFGRVVARYAGEIFAVGNELKTAVAQDAAERPLQLTVGIADVLPKLVAYALLEPALSMSSPRVKVSVQEGKTERLLADLAMHDLDLVIADAPIRGGSRIRAFNHLLGECEVGLFAAPELARRYRRGFPGSLAAAPLLLPTGNTSLRGELDRWFESAGIDALIAAEFEDSALLKVVGQHGHGVFPGSMVIAEEIQRTYGVRLLGVAEGVHERFYAISPERRVKHPAVVRIRDSSRKKLFG